MSTEESCTRRYVEGGKINFCIKIFRSPMFGPYGPTRFFLFLFWLMLYDRKNTKWTKFEKKLTLLDSINLELFLAIFVLFLNFSNLNSKYLNTRPVPTGANRYRQPPVAPESAVYRPVCTGTANPAGTRWWPSHSPDPDQSVRVFDKT
jgi:hypothetical protein